MLTYRPVFCKTFVMDWATIINPESRDYLKLLKINKGKWNILFPDSCLWASNIPINWISSTVQWWSSAHTHTKKKTASEQHNHPQESHQHSAHNKANYQSRKAKRTLSSRIYLLISVIILHNNVTLKNRRSGWCQRDLIHQEMGITRSSCEYAIEPLIID